MDVTLEQVIAAHDSLRSRAPLVQCLTNVVSAQFVANVLLAAGASPAMVDNPEEAAGFAGIADAVLVNLGTPTASQVESQRLASAAALASGTPWVLDPVGAGGLPWRTKVAAELLANRPIAVRANASEVIGLAGSTDSGGQRGVDSTAATSDSVVAARILLSDATIVAASGEIDHIVSRVDGADQLIRIRGGNSMLQRVTATGCALGALTAAYCAVAEAPLIGVTAAHILFGVAAELAQDRATGPGTFAPLFLDALYYVGEDELADFAGIEAAQLL